MKKLYFIFIISIYLQINAFSQNGWNVIHTFQQSDIRCFAFEDSLTGIAISEPLPELTIYKTTDGGISWNGKSIDGFNQYINKIIYAGNNTFIGVGGKGSVIKSTDNGDTWSIKNVGDTLDLSAVCITEDGKLFCCPSGWGYYSEYKSSIYKSLDYGNSWTINHVDSAEGFSDINFADSNIGYAVGEYKTYKTTNGGETWSPVSSFINDQYSINAIRFLNKQIGYAVGLSNNGQCQVIKTEDGGETWSIVKSISDNYTNLLDITCSGNNCVWIVGTFDILHTLDAGKHWIKQAFSPLSYLYGVECFDSLNCLILGARTLYKTTNGGFSAPILDYPKHGSEELPLNITFSWSPQDDAAQFRFQMANDSDFNELLFDSIETDSIKQIENLELNTKYFWRVQEKYQNVNGPWSIPSFFVTTKGAPKLSLPLNNSIDVSLTPTFAWNDVTLNADTYQLQLAQDSTFKEIKYDISEITIDTFKVNELVDSTLYYWRIRAKINNEYGDWSNVWSFRTLAKTPRLLSPINNSLVSPSNVSLQWSKTAKTIDYRLQISTDSLFQSIITDKDNIIGHSFNVSLNNDTKYFWRVGANDNEGQIHWSDYSSFRSWLAYFPMEIGNKFYYKACYFPYKGSYGIIKTIIDTLTDGERKIKVQKYFKDSLATSYEYWKYSNGEFYTSSNNLIYRDDPIFNGLLLRDTCIEFYPITRCYEIRDSTIFGLKRYCQIYKKSEYTKIESYRTNIITADSIGVYSEVHRVLYYYQMQDSLTLIGYVKNGEVTGDTVLLNTNSIADLIQPSNNSSDIFNPVLFKWDKVKNAISYRIQVFEDLEFPISNMYCDSIVTDTSANISLKNGTQYYWRIETKDKNGQEFWSPIWSFATVNLHYISSLKYPSNNSKDVDRPVTFKWSYVNDASYYRLQISTDSLFYNLIYDKSPIIKNDTLKTVDSLKSSTKYYWRVQTIIIMPDEETHWSQIWSFTTSSLKIISSPIYPLNNSTEVPNTVSLKWKNDSSAISYEIQISADSLFSRILFDYKNIQNTSFTVDSLNYSCKYYWRVKTVSSNGEYISQSWNFTTISLPSKFELYQNYPNPFNPATKIKYDLPESGHVTLIVYDVLGRKVATLVNEEKPAGSYEVEFNGNALASGIYFYRIKSRNYSSVKKMILLK